jgi:hypothetical protein
LFVGGVEDRHDDPVARDDVHIDDIPPIIFIIWEIEFLIPLARIEVEEVNLVCATDCDELSIAVRIK